MIKDLSVLRAADAKAREFNISPQNLLAMIDVESNGKVFAQIGTSKEPYILFEPHLLYRRMTEPGRSEAVKLGIASKEWNKKLYAKTQVGRWDQIREAKRLLKANGQDEGIAYECTSWGIGQVLGSNWKELGFSDIKHFVHTARSGAEGQIDLMIRYCARNDLIDELQEGRWTALARGYNGPRYAENAYDTKLAEAANLYGGTVAEKDGMLRIGSKGARVRELQGLLVRAGYAVTVDGDFGQTTKKVLKAYQEANGLTPDGVYGPRTEKKLGELRQSPTDKPGAQKVSQIKEVIAGTVVAIGGPGAIDAAKETIKNAQSEIGKYAGIGIADVAIKVLSYGSVVLIMAGLGYAAYGWWKSKQTKEM